MGMTVSAVARLHGISPSLLFQWRRRRSEGGRAAVQADDDVVAVSRVRELKGRIRDLERLLGRETMEVEVLREALTAAQGKNPPGSCRRRYRAVPGEGRGRHLGRRPLQPGPADQRQLPATGPVQSKGRRRGPGGHPPDHRCPFHLLGGRRRSEMSSCSACRLILTAA